MDNFVKEAGENEGLFGFVPAAPLHFDANAEARRQARERKEAQERAALQARIDNLPTREELAVKAWDIFDSHILPDTKLKAMQFYAQLMGFMGANGKPVKGESDGGTQSKVMAVPVAATAEDWEKAASGYMKKLERLANNG